MPLYEYLCRTCDVELETYASIISGPPSTVTCVECGQPTSTRVYNIAVERVSSFQPHFNKSVGRYVRTMSEFKSFLQRSSEHMEERTGVPHNYTPVDPADGVAAHSIGGEGLEATRRRRYNLTKDLTGGSQTATLAP